MGETRKSILGWREWFQFPDLGVQAVKAKVDTGARSSSLHAESIELYTLRGVDRVRFVVCPLQRTREGKKTCTAVLHDERWIKSSNGSRELRPVVRTRLVWAKQTWEVDLTLTSRDLMGFRMLLGREAMRGRFLVDTGRSFTGGRLTATGAVRLPKPRTRLVV